jgi:Spx/MgsR family transcriptional regulator
MARWRLMRLFGLSSCDTVRRARAWLAHRGAEYTYHDFKKSGVPADCLDAWIAAIGWQGLLNRKGTTWRKLDEACQQAVVDAPSARALMLAQPSVIKRPVVEWAGGKVSVGFDAEGWAASLERQ